MTERTWADHCLSLAATHAEKSKDSTKVGCFIVGPNNEPLSLGFNGPPMGVRETPERRERPEKYRWVAHAEENAVALAARSGHRLVGATAYVTHFPCSRCAGTLIQAGIRHVRVGLGTTSMPRWEFETAILKFAEAGVGINVCGPAGWAPLILSDPTMIDNLLKHVSSGFKAEAVEPEPLKLTPQHISVLRTVARCEKPKFGEMHAAEQLVKAGLLDFVPVRPGTLPPEDDLRNGRYSLTERGEAALEAADSQAELPLSNPWIKWKGGNMPVSPDAVVEVRLRSGAQLLPAAARCFRWTHTVFDLMADKEATYEARLDDVVAYRTVLPDRPGGWA